MWVGCVDYLFYLCVGFVCVMGGGGVGCRGFDVGLCIDWLGCMEGCWFFVWGDFCVVFVIVLDKWCGGDVGCGGCDFVGLVGVDVVGGV